MTAPSASSSAPADPAEGSSAPAEALNAGPSGSTNAPSSSAAATNCVIVLVSYPHRTLGTAGARTHGGYAPRRETSGSAIAATAPEPVPGPGRRASGQFESGEVLYRLMIRGLLSVNRDAP